jgi:hypothetical protein
MAKAWDASINTIKKMKNDDLANGIDWDLERAKYLTKLHSSIEENKIKLISERQADLESRNVVLSEKMMGLIEQHVDEQGEVLAFKGFKDVALAWDKVNRVHRRNLGMSETSHEMKERIEFVSDLINRFVQLIEKVESDPDRLRVYADGVAQLRSEYEPSIKQLMPKKG